MHHDAHPRGDRDDLMIPHSIGALQPGRLLLGSRDVESHVSSSTDMDRRQSIELIRERDGICVRSSGETLAHDRPQQWKVIE